MEGFEKRRMNINWILSDRVMLDPTIDIDQLKQIGSFWGGWQTWRAYQTDNVICHTMSKASELIKRNFQLSCNFYIPNSVYLDLDRPDGVRLYEGTFKHDVDNHEEIVAMHLVADQSDLVLLLGFDFTEPNKHADKLLEHKAHNYRSLTRQIILDNVNTQWVAVDHPGEFRKDLRDLDNLTQDSLANVIGMLSD